MRSLSTIRRCLLAVFVFVLFTAAAQAQEYKIKLVRPDKVGDEYSSTVTAKVDRTVEATINGVVAPAQKIKYSAECHGATKVLAVNEKTGSATKIRYQVDKMTKDGQELYPNGTVIIVEKTGPRATFTIDGDHPDDEHTDALESLLDVSNPDATVTDDEMQGTDKPQKVGNTWPIDSEKTAKDLGDNELPVNPDDLKGESKLVEVKQVNGSDAEVISTTIASDLKKGELPNGQGTVTDGSLSGDITVVMPVDASVPTISMELKMKVSMTVSQPNNAGVVSVKMKIERKEEREAK